MALLKFLKGNYSSLNNAAINEGQILICSDTGEMFVDVAADKRVKIGDFTVVSNLATLEALDATAVPTSRLYYVEDGNILARSNGTTWIQVNKQPTIAELKTQLGLSDYATKAYVGDIPTGYTEENVIAYINKKAEETLNAASGGSSESAASVLAALNTYKSENDPKVTANTDAITAIKDDADIDSFADVKTYIANEDIFETDMLTVNSHGGVAANEDLNGLTTHEILKKILYPYVQPVVGNATATPNGGTYEEGVTKTITQVGISVTKKSEAIISVALYNGSTLIEEKTGDAVKNGGTITFSGLSVEVPTSGNQLTVKVTDAKGTVITKNTSSMTFVYPYYIGTCAAGSTIDETLVESLTKKIESKGNKSNSFTVSDGHMVFAYPKSYGVLKSILDPNNFETIGNYTCSEVAITGLDGTAQTYYVYVSGATTVSGFAVNFKY